MKCKYFNEKETINTEEINKIAKEIVMGKNVIFPTETVYGIGTNAFDQEACERIFSIKGRPNNKPLIVLISDFKMLKQMVSHVNEIERKLIEEFWPGPLTIIFKKKEDSNIPDVVTAGQDTIGVRMTSGKIARLLIQKAGVPIVAPSANLTGQPTGTKIEEIIKDLGDQADYIIDCGNLDKQIPSTIVKVKNDKIYIIRQGSITKEQLEKIAIVEMEK